MWPCRSLTSLKLSMSISSSAPRPRAADVLQQARRAHFQGAAVVQRGQRIAGGQPGHALLAAVTLGAGHRQRDQHDRHRPFHQRNLDDRAAEGREVDQRARHQRRQRLAQVEQPVQQQHVAQLPGAHAQRLAVGPQQRAGAQRRQRHQQRVGQQHDLRPRLPVRQQQHGRPGDEDQVPGAGQARLGEARHAQQEQPVGDDQQAVGEPDAQERKAAHAQQSEGRAHGDGGKARAPEQQRGFANVAPFYGQVQGGGRSQGDREGQHRGRIERHDFWTELPGRWGADSKRSRRFFAGPFPPCRREARDKPKPAPTRIAASPGHAGEAAPVPRPRPGVRTDPTCRRRAPAGRAAHCPLPARLPAGRHARR